ncbi:MAG: DUF3006 domain-containing protein [Actinomycetota bacterium]|nr:DUF3006 domain-containing protein [Actinomycetota bacterium]
MASAKSGNMCMYMQVQIDSFEDDGMAVLMGYPKGRRTFDVPRELLPEGARVGDVYEVRFLRDEDETERSSAENRRLMGELLGRGEGSS